MRRCHPSEILEHGYKIVSKFWCVSRKETEVKLTLQHLAISHNLLDVVFCLRKQIKDVDNATLNQLRQLIFIIFVQDLVQHGSQRV
jgi:hypothetical protein